MPEGDRPPAGGPPRRRSRVLSSPPPGWYPDPDGTTRWWDGTAWGPAVAAPQSEEDAGRAAAVIAWLGFFLGGVVVPLVIYLLERDRNRYTRWHAAEALNLQLTFTIVWMFGIFAVMAGMIGLTVADPQTLAPFALFGALFLVYIAALAVSIVGAVMAGRNRWWRCPAAIPFLRAHRHERPVAP